MKAWRVVAQTRNGLRLSERDGEYMVQTGGKVLMTSRRHGSEDALARVGLKGLSGEEPHVLVGGLGFGFTLRAALDRLPPKAVVTVVELSPEVVDWNRGELAPLAGRPLEDARVRVKIADVGEVLRRAEHAYDAVLLDVDNGPFGVSTATNATLYSGGGVQRCARALRIGGMLAVWSAGEDGAYVQRLSKAGFEVATRPASTQAGSRTHHVVISARRRPNRLPARREFAAAKETGLSVRPPRPTAPRTARNQGESTRRPPTSNGSAKARRRPPSE